ncbi:MAG: L-rhamnose mutarotase [Paludibacter sp.]|nr:L-rhamnose mutarotase [Paludibacter sp.]
MKHIHKLFYLFILVSFVTGCSPRRLQSPAVLEIIDLDYHFSTKILLNFSNENNIDKSTIYEWQNHWIIYDDLKEIKTIKTKLESRFPSLIIKLYDKPFYNFNRQRQCGKKAFNEWNNVIMTANLVADTTMQKQYMEYHRTQFKKWPEVSKGFCNADFQQVLVFRTGRQLMLVISIPKGKTLDELNPKTTENNPRVNEWNKMMSRYQEGIEDAPKGTTWVTFKTIEN